MDYLFSNTHNLHLLRASARRHVHKSPLYTMIQHSSLLVQYQMEIMHQVTTGHCPENDDWSCLFLYILVFRFVYVDMQMSGLSKNQTYAVVSMYCDEEITDVLQQTHYSIINFCVSNDPRHVANMSDLEEAAGAFEVQLMETYHYIINRFNRKLVNTRIRQVAYVQEGEWINKYPQKDTCC